MAQIKMDVSEYETLKDNKKLLENSLAREKELSNQIQSLQLEKIRALEDAKMKVVKISKKKVIEHIYENPLCEDLTGLPTGYNNGNGVILRDFKISDIQKSQKALEMIRESLFKVVKKEIEYPDEITTTGLDEVKAELREEINKEYKDEISSLKSNIEKYSSLITTNELLSTKNKALTEELEKLQHNFEIKEKQLEKLQKESDEYKEKSSKYFSILEFNENIFRNYKNNFRYKRFISRFKLLKNE